MILRTAEYLPAGSWQMIVACLTLLGGIVLTLASQRGEQQAA
jgi:hypothetical protein